MASAAALMLAGAGVLVAAGPAQAAEVAYLTECLPPPISGLPPIEGTTKVAVSAPATAKVGDEIEVVWKTIEGASKNPDILDLAADTVQPTGTVKVAGAQAGELAMKGPRQNPPIPKNSPMKLSDMTGKLKLEKPGEVTLTPGFYNINVNKPISTDTKCTPKEEVKPAVTITVTDGGGTGGTTARRRRTRRHLGDHHAGRPPARPAATPAGATTEARAPVRRRRLRRLGRFRRRPRRHGVPGQGSAGALRLQDPHR